MIRKTSIIFFFGILIVSQMIFRIVFAQSLPTTEQFQGLLVTCAQGSTVEISTDLVGSVSDVYEGERAKGTAKFNTNTLLREILPLFPEKDRLEFSKLYYGCIKDILKSTQDKEGSVKPILNDFINSLADKANKCNRDTVECSTLKREAENAAASSRLIRDEVCQASELTRVIQRVNFLNDENSYDYQLEKFKELGTFISRMERINSQAAFIINENMDTEEWPISDTVARTVRTYQQVFFTSLSPPSFDLRLSKNPETRKRQISTMREELQKLSSAVNC